MGIRPKILPTVGEIAFQEEQIPHISPHSLHGGRWGKTLIGALGLIAYHDGIHYYDSLRLFMIKTATPFKQ